MPNGNNSESIIKSAKSVAQNWATDTGILPQDQTEIKKYLGDHLSSPLEEELVECFYKELEFGTGGIRGIMGLGSNRMNKYNIRRATYALGTVVKTRPGPHKVAIGYDSRHSSFEFAKEAASILASMNIEAHLYPELGPVALLSFAVRHLGAGAGIMVTASHNPPKYNGYKVYWSDGAQVTPPHDQMIIDAYYQQKSFAHLKPLDFNQALEKKLIQWIQPSVIDEYFRLLSSKFTLPKNCQKHGNSLHLVYTPIHGTGLKSCLRALNLLGFNKVSVVKEQETPDGRFPTVKSPNPENPEAMSLAVELMKKEKADAAFATDPDCDRLGVALVHQDKVHYLNGNQIGILMLNYILTNLQEQKRLPPNPYFVKTIVTSPLQDTIAAKFGVTVENTLTGFKWICRRMGEIEKSEPQRTFLFATEESFGYMNHNFVRDKDGICSVALMAEVCLWYKQKGLNLVQALDSIYEQYGFSNEALLTMDFEGKAGAEKIQRIMDRFRTQQHKTIVAQAVELQEDYQKREITNLKTGKITAITLPESNVLGYSFPSGDRLYLRPSGTEPKIKFYIMVQEREGNLENKKAKAQQKIDAFLTFIKKEIELA